MGLEPEQIILQRGHTEGPETHERMLAIREMPIKTTMRHHSTPVRMTTITNQQTGAGEVVEKRKP